MDVRSDAAITMHRSILNDRSFVTSRNATLKTLVRNNFHRVTTQHRERQPPKEGLSDALGMTD